MTSPASALQRARSKALGCKRCPLYQNATQTVFGEGPVPCDVMLVGEQPGDREDIEGRPFVGPAGRMLDKALEAAGLERDAVYVTNAVKHFKNEPRGKRRLHKRPTAGEIDICKWWLDAELDLVRPKTIVALGASAARALLGRPVAIEVNRGAAMPLDDERVLFVTIHPALLLRMPDRAARENAFRRFVADLTLVAEEPRRMPTRARRRNFHPSLRV
jgi:DNA polymerase